MNLGSLVLLQVGLKLSEIILEFGQGDRVEFNCWSVVSTYHTVGWRF